MSLWLSKNDNIIILDKTGIVGDTLLLEQKMDVVLTPSFYWFVEKKLSLKFNFQVREYLPSIFEEFTNSANLSYLAVSKGDDLFWLFAYDDKTILKSLVDMGVDPSKVKKIYFAQNVFSKEKYITLNDGYMLANIESTISRVPKSCMNSKITSKEISQKVLSLQNGVTLKKYTSFIDDKLVKKFMIPLMLIVIIMGVEAISVWNKNKNLSQQSDKVFTSYNLPPTSFQNKAILSNIKIKSLKQQKVRTFMKAIFRAPLKNTEYIQMLDINEKNANISIKLKKIKNAETLKKYFMKKIDFADIQKILVKDKKMKVKFRL